MTVFRFITTLLLIFSFENLKSQNCWIIDDELARYSHFGKIDTIIENRFVVKDENSVVEKSYEEYGKSRIVSIFDYFGNVQELIIYKNADVVNNRYTYQYDSLNRLVERKVFNSDKQLVHEIKIRYSSLGNIETSYYFDGKSEPTTKWIFEFQTDNKVTQKRTYPADNKVYMEYIVNSNKLKIKEKNDDYYWIYKYDSVGNKTFEEKNSFIQIENEDGIPAKPIYFIDYSYDLYSNMILKSYNSSRNKELLEFKYEYDNQNNWVKMIEYKDNIPKILSERKIIYKK